jgi:hypothetical protein
MLMGLAVIMKIHSFTDREKVRMEMNNLRLMLRAAKRALKSTLYM